MLGGVRTLLLQQEQYVWPTPLAVPMVVPTVTMTLGVVPIRNSGSYTPAVVGAGSFTKSITNTVG